MKYIAATLAELEIAVDAWGKAAGFPFPPDGMSKATADAGRAAWLAAPRAQRVTLGRTMERAGWTVRPAEIRTEPRGNRFWCEVPDDLVSVVLPAAASIGRSLNASEDTALRAARARLTDDFPTDWQGKTAVDITTAKEKP